MPDVLSRLLDVSEHERPELMERVEECAENVTIDLATGAQRAGHGAWDAGDLARAEAAFMLSWLLWQRLKEWAASIDCAIDLAQVMNVRAQSVEQFELARGVALGAMVTARHFKLPERLFSARVIVADSAYFAAQSLLEEHDLVEYAKWLLTATQDCLDALDLIEVGPDSPHGRNFLTLVVSIVHDLSSRSWFDEEKARVEDALRRFALAIEGSVSPGAARSDDPEQTQAIAQVLAKLSYKHGSPDKARARLTAVIERAAQVGDLSSFLSASAQRYSGERTSYRPGAELSSLRAEFRAAVDRFRLTARSRGGRLWKAQELDDMTGEMVLDEFAMLIGRDSTEAFSAVEINRARTLLDEMAGVTRSLPDEKTARTALDLEAEVLHLEATGENDAVAHEHRLVSRLPLGGLTVESGTAEALERLESFYADHNAGFVGQGVISKLDDVIEALGEDEALIEYHIPYEFNDPAGTLLILLVTSEGALTIHLPLLHQPDDPDKPAIVGRIQADGKQPLDLNPLLELIANTRISIQQGDDPSAIARLEVLHNVLIAPLANYGIEPAQFRRLVVVPHGVLHAVPFAALKGPSGRFLAEETSIALAPSASIWERLHRRPVTPASSFLGFADPSLPEPYEPLTEARDELEDIASLLHGLDATLHVGDAATETALRRDVRGRSIVHFATHGEFPEFDVMNMHRILLAPEGGEDGRVHAEELRGMDLDAAQLVTLSICDGGLYRFGPGDEPYGLMSALLAAGARNVVGPAWEIDDRLGRLLIVEFYRGLLEFGPAEALRRACVARMQAGADIRDWAGFVLVGAG